MKFRNKKISKLKMSQYHSDSLRFTSYQCNENMHIFKGCTTDSEKHLVSFICEIEIIKSKIKNISSNSESSCHIHYDNKLYRINTTIADIVTDIQIKEININRDELNLKIPKLIWYTMIGLITSYS